MKPGETAPTEDTWTEVLPAREDKVRMKEILSTCGRSDAETPHDLKEDIMTLVSAEYGHTLPRGVRLVELNRRFGVKANSLGTKVRDLVTELVDSDKVLIFKHRDSVVVVDRTKHLNAMRLLKLFPKAKIYDYDKSITIDHIMEMEENSVLERAFNLAKK